MDKLKTSTANANKGDPSSVEKLSQPACSYCKIPDHSLVKCSHTGCDRWFCNNKQGLEQSHIVYHLLSSSHHEITLSSSSQLECIECGDNDAFKLSIVESGGIFLLCSSCATLEKYIGSSKLSLLVSQGILSTHVVKDSKQNILKSFIPPKQNKIDKKELDWKAAALPSKIISMPKQKVLLDCSPLQASEGYKSTERSSKTTDLLTQASSSPEKEQSFDKFIQKNVKLTITKTKRHTYGDLYLNNDQNFGSTLRKGDLLIIFDERAQYQEEVRVWEETSKNSIRLMLDEKAKRLNPVSTFTVRAPHTNKILTTANPEQNIQAQVKSQGLECGIKSSKSIDPRSSTLYPLMDNEELKQEDLLYKSASCSSQVIFRQPSKDLNQEHVKITLIAKDGKIQNVELDRTNEEHFKGMLTSGDSLLLIDEQTKFEAKGYVKEVIKNKRIRISLGKKAGILNPFSTFKVTNSLKSGGSLRSRLKISKKQTKEHKNEKIELYTESPSLVVKKAPKEPAVSLSTQEKSKPCCSYCNVSDQSVAQCSDPDCKKWFCNNKLGLTKSHIVTHLKISKHSRITLVSSFRLRCAECGNDDVFNLSVARKNEVITQLCTTSCVTGEKYEKYQTLAPLIGKSGLSIHVTETSEPKTLNNIPPLTKNEVEALELEWGQITAQLKRIIQAQEQNTLNQKTEGVNKNILKPTNLSKKTFNSLLTINEITEENNQSFKELPNKESNPTQSLGQPCCSYCKISDQSVVRCSDAACNRWFCNNKQSLDKSHVVLHLLSSNHHQISLSSSPLSLQCAECGNSNAFELTVVTVSGTKILLCSSSCLSKEKYLEHAHLGTLIEESRVLLQIVKRSEHNTLLGLKFPNQKTINELELVWRKESTSSQLVSNPKTEDLIVKKSILINDEHKTAAQHTETSGSLIRVQETIQNQRHESLALRSVKIIPCIKKNILYGDLHHENDELLKQMLREGDSLNVIDEITGLQIRANIRQTPRNKKIRIILNTEGERLNTFSKFTVTIVRNNRPKTQEQSNIISVTDQNKPSCSYCKISDSSIVKCSDASCNKWFCNNKLGLAKSHIVHHLLSSNHQQVSLVSSLQLQCSQCGEKDVFQLLLTQFESKEYLLCRTTCIKQEKYAAYQYIHPLTEDNKLSQYIVKESVKKMLEGFIPPGQNEVDRKEAEWKATRRNRERRNRKKRSKKLKATNEPPKEQGPLGEHLPQTQGEYESADHYKLILKSLIEAERDSQEDACEELTQTNVTVTPLESKMYANLNRTNEDHFRNTLKEGDALVITDEKSGWHTMALVEKTDPRQDVLVFLGEDEERLDPLSTFTVKVIFIDVPFKRIIEGLFKFRYGDNISKDLQSIILGNVSYSQIIALRDSRIGTQYDLTNDLSIISASSLNESQRKAAIKALGPSPIVLIQGPPGTGKTTTLTTTILQFVKNMKSHHKIMVCAPSNLAVDNVTEGIIRHGLKDLIVRVYAISRQNFERKKELNEVALHNLIKKDISEEFQLLLEKKKARKKLSKKQKAKLFALQLKAERAVIDSKRSSFVLVLHLQAQY